MRVQYIVLIFLLLALIVFPSYADTNQDGLEVENSYNLDEKCDSFFPLWEYATKGLSSEFIAFTLRQGETAQYILLLSEKDKKNKIERNQKGLYLPWRLLRRQRIPDSVSYCLVFAGDREEPLKSLHQVKVNKSYGMPGSGSPRCTEYDADISDKMGVRLWANKELGKSFTWHLHSEIGESNLTFLISNDGHWILIEDPKNLKEATCYYDRGDNTIMRDLKKK